jgi:hypothetical protein
MMMRIRCPPGFALLYISGDLVAEAEMCKKLQWLTGLREAVNRDPHSYHDKGYHDKSITRMYERLSPYDLDLNP